MVTWPENTNIPYNLKFFINKYEGGGRGGDIWFIHIENLYASKIKLEILKLRPFMEDLRYEDVETAFKT